MHFVFWLETLIVGIAIGCFTMFGIVALCIHLDERRLRHEAVKSYARQFGVSYDTAKQRVFIDK